MRTNNVNIYSPKEPGDDAFIIGNLKGLLSLKAAIEKSIEYNKPAVSPMYTDRGEDCNIVVALTNTGLDGKLTPPYTGEYYAESSKSPGDLTPKEVYAELMLAI